MHVKDPGELLIINCKELIVRWVKSLYYKLLCVNKLLYSTVLLLSVCTTLVCCHEWLVWYGKFV